MADSSAQAALSRLLGALYGATGQPRTQAAYLRAITTGLNDHGFDLHIESSQTEGNEGPVSLAADGGARLRLGPLTAVKPEKREGRVWMVGRFGAAEGHPPIPLLLHQAKAEQGIDGEDVAAHVARALSLNQSLTGRLRRYQAATGLLDGIPLGILLVGNGSQVHLANHIGQEILDEKDGFFIERDLLTTPLPKDTNRLRKIIGRVAAAGVDSARMPVGVLRLERPSFARAWMIVIIPVAGTIGSGGPMAALFVSDGERTPSIPPGIIEKLFGLTPAEARLLGGLVDGYSLDDAAELFGVSKNTLRNQLNQVFRKTDTSKQSELMRLVLTSPAPLLVNVTRSEPPDKS